MDNLSTHRSKKSTEAMARLGFRYIFNIAYAPDFNPIELTFSKVKAKFKTLRAQKVVGVIQVSHEALITQAVKSVRKQDIVNCVNHV